MMALRISLEFIYLDEKPNNGNIWISTLFAQENTSNTHDSVQWGSEATWTCSSFPQVNMLTTWSDKLLHLHTSDFWCDLSWEVTVPWHIEHWKWKCILYSNHFQSAQYLFLTPCYFQEIMGKWTAKRKQKYIDI